MVEKLKNANDLLRGIASGLKTAAIRPNIHGYLPSDKQTSFHSAATLGRLLLGGNRSGKTVAGAAEAVMRLVGRHPFQRVPEPPVYGRAVAVDFINGVDKFVKPEIARWMPLSELEGDSWNSAYDGETRTLSLKNGSKLEFMSYEQDIDKHAGTSRDFIWFDEEPPEAIWRENLQRLIDRNGKWWITMTPVEGMTWTFDRVYIPAKTDPNLFTVEIGIWDNYTLNKDEIDAHLASLTDEEREARAKGKFIAIGGLIYKTFDDTNICDPFLPGKELLHFAMMDHGFNHPTAWLWGAVDRDGVIWIYQEHVEAGRTVKYHAAQVLQVEREIGIPMRYRVGDPAILQGNASSGLSILTEYSEHGVGIFPGNNNVRAGVNRVAKYIEGVKDDAGIRHPKLIFCRNCPRAIEEHSRYRWATWNSVKIRTEKGPRDEPEKKKDDTCDAVRYGVMSRPEVDSGRGVPVFQLPPGVSVAVGATGRQDRELVRKKRPRAYVDQNLGSDY